MKPNPRITKPNGMPQRVVVIGGGTGTSTVLAGLTPFIGAGLTAVVNPFDDGGGTGQIRNAYLDLSAVGDLRQCAMAMSVAPKEVKALFNHRFPMGSADSDLNIYGQTLGNLIIAAAGQQAKGNLSEALKAVSDVFGVVGQVLPASHDVRRLHFKLVDGQEIDGEHAAEETDIPSFKGVKISFTGGPASISKEALKAIKAADMVVLAPGDLYTSLAPVLVIDGMREALLAAKVVVMIPNLMNRSRHTKGFTVLDYIQEFDRMIGAKVIKRVIYNTGTLDQKALREQAAVGSQPVEADVDGLIKEGYVVSGYNLLSHDRVVIDPNDTIASVRSTIRHDSGKVAAALFATWLNNGFSGKKKS